MKLIVITAEKFLENEAIIINRLFEEGLETLHLRKPDATANDLRLLINEIHPDYHPRIVLHDHFELTNEFSLKGVHLNRRNPQPPAGCALSISKSCHSLEELTDIEAYNYVFLSPVFDSISKDGYCATFSEDVLMAARDKQLINSKVYALGGISVDKIPLAARYGFGGVAVLGALWEGYGNELFHHRVTQSFTEFFIAMPHGT